MTRRRKRDERVSRNELRRPFADELGERFGPFLTPQQLADLLCISRSTIYFWLEQGWFKGAARKRGKHVRIFRDKALDIFFNGPDWS